MLVSRLEKLLNHFKTRLEALGYTGVSVTCKEKDALNNVINNVKPRIVLMGSNFYSGATPYMVGRLAGAFPKVNFCVLSTGYFSDTVAARFIFHGAKSYVKLADGIDEFHLGLKYIREGKRYVACDVQRVIDALPAWPEMKTNADKRQFEVLLLLCNGKKPVDIADKLHISRRTVDWHIEELFTVFGVNSREELTATAFYLEVVTKDDLYFINEKQKETRLPEWAGAQRTMNKYQRTMNSEQ